MIGVGFSASGEGSGLPVAVRIVAGGSVPENPDVGILALITVSRNA